MCSVCGSSKKSNPVSVVVYELPITPKSNRVSVGSSENIIIQFPTEMELYVKAGQNIILTESQYTVLKEAQAPVWKIS